MMLSDDTKNAFERRKPQTSLADDQKNKFDREKDRRDAERRDTSTHDARVQKIEDQNAKWVHKNFQTTAAGGTKLPPSLAKDKAASDASLKAPTAAPLSVGVDSIVETVAALVRDWKQNSPNGKNFLALFEQNDWNREQLTQATQHLIQIGHPINSQLPEDAFLLCYNGNHLDPRKRRDRAGNVIYLRGEARRPAPVPFPRVIWPDEAAAIQEEEAQQALATAAAETARAKSLPFDELKRQATKDRKPASPLMGPMVS
jgi:hypothetical protein